MNRRRQSRPKYVGVTDVVVVVSGPMGKTFETTCLAENHHEFLFKALDQACSVRRAPCQFPRPVRGGLFAKSASKPCVRNRPKYSEESSWRASVAKFCSTGPAAIM